MKIAPDLPCNVESSRTFHMKSQLRLVHMPSGSLPGHSALERAKRAAGVLTVTKKITREADNSP